MAKSSDWRTISLQPLSGGLDVRSVPADIPPGYFRWKLNAQTTPEGKLGRRPGFSRPWSASLYDDEGVPLTDPAAGNGVNYHNHDHHYVGGTREPITFMQEVTWGDKSRNLFDGTQSRISLLDETTGYWEDLVTGKGADGSYWTAAFLQDTVLFTNDVDNVLAYPQGGPAAEIPDLRDTVKCTAARIAVEFNGTILLMNTVEDADDGKGPRRFASRVRWCDLNLPLSWTLGVDSVAGYQDLDYGDEILAAGFLLGSLYVYTRRKIWRVTVSGVAGEGLSIFNFQDVYAEPKNQVGCIAYPRSLISTGSSHYFLSRDGVYKYNPFVPAPVREDWLHRASGVIFTKPDTRMNGVICNNPVGEFRPEKRELWFSWASGSNTVNDYSLVAQIDFETADVVDHGFSSFCNYRQLPLTDVMCNEVQSLLGASTSDYCIKDIGVTYSREMIALNLNDDGQQDPTLDIVLDADTLYYEEGYYTIVRGMAPLGYFDREKIIKNVLLEDSTVTEAEPCVARLRLGNSYHLADPNDQGEHCTVVWRNCGTKELKCLETLSVSEMQAQNIRPSEGKDWAVYERGRFLYFEFRVQEADGSAAIGAETYWQRIDFTALAAVT